MPRSPRKSPGRSRRRTLGAVGVAAAYGLLPLTAAFAAVPAPGDADLAVAGALRPNAAAGAAREHREAAGAVARETYDYVLTVTNRGPSAARQVRVTDRLPASLEFVASRDGCSVSGRTVTCGPPAALPVGASHSWVITVRLAADYRGDGGDIVNEAVVGADTPDPDGLNNTTSLTGLKIPPSARAADLSLRKTALLAKGREDVRPGEKFTYLIAVHNQGPATARQVTVTDRLPSSLALLSSPDDCAVPKGEDRLVVCPPLARLAAGESAEFRITVRGHRGAGPSAGPRVRADRERRPRHLGELRPRPVGQRQRAGYDGPRRRPAVPGVRPGRGPPRRPWRPRRFGGPGPGRTAVGLGRSGDRWRGPADGLPPPRVTAGPRTGPSPSEQTRNVPE
ncbi:DUF11 domain-containing protein [Streptomyces lavendulae]|uniref:DUF11 domain-containing protein n=1 Tax=Streptomyces lavendulae TaxID=1914 RepID=UPI0033DC972A